jgi:hypothetical protein
MQHGPFQIRFLDRNESVLVFRTPEEALHLLKRFAEDETALKVFRRMLPEDAAKGDLTDEQLLETMASYLASGRLKLLRSSRPAISHDSSVEQGTPAEGKGPTPRKTSWIEINLKDPDGKPVPGERYQIQLPDGSIQEGYLDGYGHAEYYDINPGNCKVSFPDMDADAWERLKP